VIPLLEALAVVLCPLALLIVGVWTAVSKPK
jgi:hypothetical protein